MLFGANEAEIIFSSGCHADVRHDSLKDADKSQRGAKRMEAFWKSWPAKKDSVKVSLV